MEHCAALLLGAAAVQAIDIDLYTRIEWKSETVFPNCE